jgi:50S ribosomal protein L16 3-hydroxylase
VAAFFNTGLTQQEFLAQYWQKKPLLIRGAFKDFNSPVTPEELAGLACEQDIESRLIQEHTNDGPWQVQTGPFEDSTFSNLPATHWTLLVQDVDKHLPETQFLLDPFRFIPDWRRDDLMISFAPEQGSVGPHTDGYDVFLIQAMGTRRWQISDHPVFEGELIDDIAIRVLKQFEPDQSWDLEAGDILYLPPHFAHHGVALNDCMTFSVGFRAPTQQEILDSVVDTVMEHGLANTRYGDEDLKLSSSQTEIGADTITRVKQQLCQLINQADDEIATALGRLFTESKPDLSLFIEENEQDEISHAEVEQLYEQGQLLQRNLYGRFAWSKQQQGCQLFFAGREFCLANVEPQLLSLLTESSEISHEAWQQLKQQPAYVELLCQLIEAGAWYWP